MATESRTRMKLGKYKLGPLLGKGGMAEVYQAYDPDRKCDVAIKLISTANQPADFVKRFRREYDFAKRKLPAHPNIVEAYDAGEHAGFVYMVQELLPGPSLEQKIRKAGKRYVPLKDVHAIIEQLASALDHAHEQGVVHRDVKPSNALYNANGNLVLTDFGIARSLADPSHTITQEGVIMGTPGYIAPEQAISSANVTAACDVYSLGVVLFELLTGRLPFDTGTTMEVVLKHLYEDPPRPSSLRSDIPKRVDDVVLRAMNKEPTKRYLKAGKLSEALQQAWPNPAARSSSRSIRKPSNTAAAQKGAAAAPRSRSSSQAAAPGSTAKAKAGNAAKQNNAAHSRTKEKPDTRQRRKTNWLLRMVLFVLVVGALVASAAGAACYSSPVSAAVSPYLSPSVLTSMPSWVGETCPAFPPDTMTGPHE